MNGHLRVIVYGKTNCCIFCITNVLPCHYLISTRYGWSVLWLLHETLEDMCITVYQEPPSPVHGCTGADCTKPSVLHTCYQRKHLILSFTWDKWIFNVKIDLQVILILWYFMLIIVRNKLNLVVMLWSKLYCCVNLTIDHLLEQFSLLIVKQQRECGCSGADADISLLNFTEEVFFIMST